MVGVGFTWVWVRGGRGEGCLMTRCHVAAPIEVQNPTFKPINVVFKIIPHLKNGPFKEAKKASKKLYM